MTHPVATDIALSIKKIAVLTDFSPVANAALRYTATLARFYEAGIVLAHAYLPPSSACAAPEAALATEAFDTLRENLEDRLLRMAHEPWLRDIDCTAALCVGSTRDLLRELNDADLVVIGTAGHLGLEKTVLGSTAELAFRTCSKPVLTVGPRFRFGGEEEAAVDPILCAVNFTVHAERSLACALSIAAAHKAHLLLLHAIERHADILALEQACARAEALDKIRQLLPETARNANTTLLVDFGNADTAILNEARVHGAKLIVMGAHKATAALAGRFAGGTAYSVAANAECPVLTIPVPTD
ncbi:MAG: universal stress protein [Silvibacterium sp.]|nr:universal stress protein [Silvibacterium sp.]